jgi:hypothetical protein
MAVVTYRSDVPFPVQIVTEIVAPDWPSFVRQSALRADSFLARLSDTEFDQGMAALRAHGANINPAEAVTGEIDWFVFTKKGFVPVFMSGFVQPS